MADAAPITPVKLTFPEYIEANKALLAPPVCNKMIHNDGKLRVMIVGGPNQRKDYHLNQGEEFFFQIKGDMCLKVVERGAPKDVVIKEGQCFNLPGSVPHSPQRFADTVGLVIERLRPESQLDGLRYYVDDSNQAVLWQRYFHVYDLGVQLKPLIAEFFASEENASRVPSKDLPAPAFAEDTTTAVMAPFPMADKIAALKAGGGTPVPLFDDKMEFKISLVGAQAPALPIANECWVWQLEGSSAVNGEALAASQTYLCPAIAEWVPAADSVALLVFTTGC
jgi:3-hydroxyanthranilate 3,4-dioxygenase